MCQCTETDTVTGVEMPISPGEFERPPTRLATSAEPDAEPIPRESSLDLEDSSAVPDLQDLELSAWSHSL